MTTRETVRAYFDRLAQRDDWQSLLADGMVFTSFTSPVKRITGRTAYVEATRRFYSMIASMEVRDLLVDGEKACALTRYELQPPRGDAFASDVAELFTVAGGAIQSLAIYFDSAPFPK